MTPEIVLYLARADNGVIGRDGAIPWRIPGEQARFKAMTMGKPMVMGRRTFQSLPGLLPGRRHIVLTRDPDWRAPGAEPAATPADAIAQAGAVPEIAVIGGAEVYALFLPLADRIELTQVHASPAGDARIAAPDPAAWIETARAEQAGGAAYPAFSTLTFHRRGRGSHRASASV